MLTDDVAVVCMLTTFVLLAMLAAPYWAPARAALVSSIDV
jgi:hypothetical protein